MPTSQMAPSPAAERKPSPHAHAGPLLVATAGRGAAEVLHAARFLAGRLGARPIVIAVHEPTIAYLPEVGMAPLLPELDQEQRALLREDVSNALEGAGGDAPGWRLEVVTGPPARTIARIAGEVDACMVVMGIGRHAPLDRVFGAETTLQAIRLADRPVLAVAPGADVPPRRVAVAVDFSPPSIKAAEEALALIAEGGTLSLVHVRPVGSWRPQLDEQSRRRFDRRVSDLFSRLRGMLSPSPSVTIEQVVLDGNPAAELVAFAKRGAADLIASGSSGLGFVDRLIMGSVATQILRRSTTSVLVVPRPSPAEVERLERRFGGVSSDS